MIKVQNVIDVIEKDIYEDSLDSEIVCPYCNNEFLADIDDEETEIECPECHNIIELDMNIDTFKGEYMGCSGDCRFLRWL